MLIKKFFKTKPEAEITFEYPQENVESVSLVADFNNWQPVEMKLNKKAKAFRTKVKLPQNSAFHFRYLVNGSEWQNDQKADQYIANEFGSENSVVTTQV